MKLSFSKCLSLFCLLSTACCFLPKLLSAQEYFEVTPSISVNTVYNDNIFVRPENEESDSYIAISPSISLDRQAEHNVFDLRYVPTFVFYKEFSENNILRHFAELTFDQKLGNRLKFDLTNTFIKSEVPIEETEGVIGVRRTRAAYWRNIGQTSISYLFGPENNLTTGYSISILENEDPFVNDGTTQTLFGDFSYWFNVKNGFEFGYNLVKADFSKDDGLPARDDYKGNNAFMRYILRFKPKTRAFIRYDFADRNFERLTEDYQVHDVSVGFDHSFSPVVSLAIAGGYFLQDNEISDDLTGISYNLSLANRFERVSIQVGGQGGWSEHYLEAEPRAFVQSYGLNTTIEYKLFEKLSIYGGGFFRLSEDVIGEQWKDLGGNVELRWNFRRWFNLTLNYSYAQRDDDIDTRDFKVNQVVLSLSVSKPYRL